MNSCSRKKRAGRFPFSKKKSTKKKEEEQSYQLGALLFQRDRWWWWWWWWGGRMVGGLERLTIDDKTTRSSRTSGGRAVLSGTLDGACLLSPPYPNPERFQKLPLSLSGKGKMKLEKKRNTNPRWNSDPALNYGCRYGTDSSAGRDFDSWLHGLRWPTRRLFLLRHLFVE